MANLIKWFQDAANNVGQAIDNVVPGNQSALHRPQAPQQPVQRPQVMAPPAMLQRPVQQPQFHMPNANLVGMSRGYLNTIGGLAAPIVTGLGEAASHDVIAPIMATGQSVGNMATGHKADWKKNYNHATDAYTNQVYNDVQHMDNKLGTNINQQMTDAYAHPGKTAAFSTLAALSGGLGDMGAVGNVVSRGTGLGFGAYQLAQTPKLIKAYNDAKTPEEKSQALTEGILGTGLGVLSAAHGAPLAKDGVVAAGKGIKHVATDPVLNNQNGFIAGSGAKDFAKNQAQGKTFIDPADNLPKFEVSDHKASVRNGGLKELNNKGETTLGNLINHKELFKQYGKNNDTFDARSVRVTADSNLPPTRHGQYDPATNTITLNPELLRTKDDILNSLVHENQHPIDVHEGVFGGTNPEQAGGFYNYLKDIGEQRARDQAARRTMTPAERAATPSIAQAGPDPLQALGYLQRDKVAQAVKDTGALTASHPSVGVEKPSSVMAYEGQPRDGVGKFSNGKQEAAKSPLHQEALKYKTAKEFTQAQLDKYGFTNDKPIKTYRGEGESIHNSTLVHGKYMADSPEFAANFGKVSEHQVPAGSKIFDLDKVKNGSSPVVADATLVEPDRMTNYLIDHGFTHTRNTNTRGVEYVELKRGVKSAAKERDAEIYKNYDKRFGALADKFKTESSFIKAAEKANDDAWAATDYAPDKYQAVNESLLKDYFKSKKRGITPGQRLDDSDTTLTKIFNEARSKGDTPGIMANDTGTAADALHAEATKHKTAEDFVNSQWNGGLPKAEVEKYLANTEASKKWSKLLADKDTSSTKATQALDEMRLLEKKYEGKKSLKLTEDEKASVQKKYAGYAKTLQNHLDNYGDLHTRTGYIEGKGKLIEASNFDGAKNAQEELTKLYNKVHGTGTKPPTPKSPVSSEIKKPELKLPSKSETPAPTPVAKPIVPKPVEIPKPAPVKATTKPTLPEVPKKQEVKPPTPVKATDTNGNQLALPAPKNHEQKAASKVETKQQKTAVKAQMTAEKVAAKGPVSPAEAKRIFKSTGIAPEVLQKNKIKQTPMVGTDEGIVTKTPNNANRAALKEQAHKLDVYSLGGKDRHPFKLSRETPDRIQDDVFGKNSGKVKAFLNDAVRKNETNRLSFVDEAMTKFEDTYKKAGITRGSAEDKLGFRYGEGHMTKEEVLKAAPKHGQAIIDAADAQRKFYDETLDKINTSLRHYGYPEIPKRANYLTHTQEIGNVFERLGNILSNDKSKLPTAMSGINMDTKPGKSWFKFAQQRKGGAHDESLVRSFEAYLPGASNQIFHTDSIQRARALQNALTDPKMRVEAKTPAGTLVRSSERNNVGVLTEVKGGEATVHFTNKAKGTEQTVTLPLEKLSLAKNAGDGSDLSNYNSWLSEYANTLAGKKISIDRPFEKLFGRQILEVGSALKRRSGANMIGGNLSSAVTNFIPLTQSIATTSKPAVVKALFEATRQPFSPKPGMIDGMQSTFLKNRFAKTDMSLGKLDSAKAKAGWLFEAVDRFTSETVLRGKYNELVSKGVGKEQALARADKYARNTLADRSVGEMPLLFNSKALGAFTQFQLEVNNQVSVLMKDIPQNAKSRTQLASQLTQVVLYSYIANNLYQQVMGRRPAIDPIEYALNLKANIDKANSKDDTKKKVKGYVDAAGNLVGDVTSGLPFGNIPTLLMGKDGGRMPFTAGLPDPTQVVSHPIRELTKPITTYALPMGGGQISKSATGIEAFLKGKVTDASGKTQFNIDQNPVNFAKVAAFGKYADPNGVRYLANKGISPGTAPALSKAEQAAQDIKNLTDASNAKGTNRKASSGSSTSNAKVTLPKGTPSSSKDNVAKYFPTEHTPVKTTVEAANRMAAADKTIASNVSTTAHKTLVNYAKLDTKGKSDYNNDPAKVYQLHLAQYENDKANGKFNQIEDYKKLQSLGKEAVTSKYSQEVQQFYGMSKAQQSAYFAQDRAKATDLYEQAKQLDAELGAKKFATGTKYKYGLGTKGRTAKGKSTKFKLPKTNASLAIRSSSAMNKLMGNAHVKAVKVPHAPKLAKAKPPKIPKTRTITTA